LPKIIDPDNDKVKIQVLFGAVSDFSTQSSINIIFAPKENNNGSYQIDVILTDS
jgi:hypothetical protein